MNQMMFKTLFFFLWGVLAVAGRAEDKNPRVLMIVDSIHRSTASAAAIALKAKAELVIPQIDPGSTGEVIGRLDQLLGKEKWDLIHFNFGFADLCHVDPKTKSRRVLSRHGGGKRMTSPEAYEEN